MLPYSCVSVPVSIYRHTDQAPVSGLSARISARRLAFIPMPLALPSLATLADRAFALRLVAHARRPGLPRHDDSACQLLVIAIPASPSRDGFLFSGHVLRHP